VIFKAVQDGRPYPAHDLTLRDWSKVPPRQVRLDELVTTKRVLALDVLLDDDSTFYGDLFPHVVLWNGELYLEDGLHRALRAALQQRTTLHVRVLDLDRPAEERVEADAGGGVGVEVCSGGFPSRPATTPTSAGATTSGRRRRPNATVSGTSASGRPTTRASRKG
jgi:Arc/MetJ family transcription regulator